jgi:hydroxymethylpyrimidine pyrophosphatase-like HAD family hydrolase
MFIRPNVYLFDLDGTLAALANSIDDPMAKVLQELLCSHIVCVISGSKWEHFEEQLVNRLPEGSNLENLRLFPTCGTTYYKYDIDDSEFKMVYNVGLSKSGVDKSFAIGKIEQIFGIPKERMVFFGDALEPGGNDHAVYQTGILSIPVDDHIDCLWKIRLLFN